MVTSGTRKSASSHTPAGRLRRYGANAFPSLARDAARTAVRPVLESRFPGVPLEPATDCVIDNATFEEPARYPTGIEHVIVNGTFVIRDGEHTGARPGAVMRGRGYTPD